MMKIGICREISICRTQYRTGDAKILEARESARVRATGVNADGLGVTPSSVPGVL